MELSPKEYYLSRSFSRMDTEYDGGSGDNPEVSRKVMGLAGSVVGAGVGMAASNRNLEEWKALRSKPDKTPAEKARVKHLRRIISAKVGGGAIVGGASAAYLARK